MARRINPGVTGSRSAPLYAADRAGSTVVRTRGGQNVNTGKRGNVGVAWTKAWGDLKKFSEQARRGAHVRVGVLSNGAHGAAIRGTKQVGERGTARRLVNQAFNVTTIDLVTLAAIHEFGSPAAGIPERSFIRRTLDQKHGEIAALAGKLAKAIVYNKISHASALEILGQFLAAEIKKTIADTIPPPLKPATIAARKRQFGKASSKPLIATGQLRAAVSHKVHMAGDGEVTS